MRFHTTTPFNHLLVAIHKAQADFETAFDEDPEGEQTKAGLQDHMTAVYECLQHPAVTPTELRLKLCLYRDNNVADWTDRPASRDAFEAMINDTVTLQGYYPGPDMFHALADWRQAYEPFQFIDTDSDDGERAARDRTCAFRALMDTYCTTPGDFIAKSYVNLLELLGHTFRGEPTGNIFDPNIDREDDEIDDTCAFHRAAYFDIDHSDVGANLMAYGRPNFSAEHWMERADAIGLKVHVIAASDDQQRMLWVATDIDAEPNTPPSREANRLQRILAFDPVRRIEVVEEIQRDWPQLIFVAPKPVEV